MRHFDAPPDRPSDFAVPPGFRFVDPHVHLFDHAQALSWRFHDRGYDHPRLKGAWRLDDDRFSVPQYQREVAGLGVEKFVHIQSGYSEADPALETAWLQSLSDRYGMPNAMMSGCDLASDGAAAVLDVQSAHRGWRGVRHTGALDSVGSDAFMSGYRELVTRHGVCDLWVEIDQFPALTEIARQHSDVIVVLEHAGLPVVSKLDAYQERWRTSMKELAKSPNVVCKISALSSGALPNFFVDSIRDWVLHCIDAFGPDRCMFASNFPIDRMFVTYPRLLSAFRRVVENFTPTEQRQLFAETAERVYRI
ncbi:MAG: amidohydrolase family protein [Acidimicrobiales bacterium]|nr:amidohydrolase family protein [Acidimicrobiales bacterium]